MSKMRRNRIVAMLTLCTTIMSGAAVTYAYTNATSLSLYVKGSARLAVKMKYITRVGKDQGDIDLAFYGKQEDKSTVVMSNTIYYKKDNGDTHDLEYVEITDTVCTHKNSYRFPDANSFRLQIKYDDGRDDTYVKVYR